VHYYICIILSRLSLLQAGKLHKNQPYDESLEIPDAEEVASQFSPTPRVEINKGVMCISSLLYLS